MVEMGKIRSNYLVYIEFSSLTKVERLTAILPKIYYNNFVITVEMNHS